MTRDDALARARARIDALDRQLILVLAQRQRLVELVASLKGCTDNVRDPMREQAVLEQVRIMAAAAGLSGAIALPLWEDMIGHFSRHQIDWLTRRHPGQTLAVVSAAEGAAAPLKFTKDAPK